ncbi:hypothetical protein [Parasphingorhabdus cellanae]|uniref:Lipoprotein n=1 Tax=Parasphingorhabdus cellanae TaxID=2806553 RepID=A0ABX7T2N2_9SPHN|nr:hypothetical protein [Parasphingorhabdus cellanae]QTD55801.1 hypothetical protein J4G78_16680 [Parasphingorhabdus cellanae]
MRRKSLILLVFPILVLPGCKEKFDEKFEDNLQQLESEAEQIELQTDERLAAGQEAEKAAEQMEQRSK